MKKLTFSLMTMVLSLSAFPTQMIAVEKESTTIATNTKEVPAEVKSLLTRLDEIKVMDKSSMKSSDKKELRKEVRAINTELRSTGNGVYLSVGLSLLLSFY